MKGLRGRGRGARPGGVSGGGPWGVPGRGLRPFAGIYEAQSEPDWLSPPRSLLFSAVEESSALEGKAARVSPLSIRLNGEVVSGFRKLQGKKTVGPERKMGDEKFGAPGP